MKLNAKIFGKLCLTLSIVLSLAGRVPAQNTPPTLKKIDPAALKEVSQTPFTVSLTGTGFDDHSQLEFDPPKILEMVSGTWKQSNGVSATANLKLLDILTTVSKVNIWVRNSDGTTSGMFPFAIGVASTVCLESLQTGECQLRWEIETTSATASNGQTNNSTALNLLARLDYQWQPPKDQVQKALARMRLDSLLKGADQDTREKALKKLANSPLDHFSGHADFVTGYTQVPAATKVQASQTGSGSSSSGGSTSSVSCPTSTSTSSTTCTAAVPQEAFIAQIGGRFAWATHVNGEGTFAELGIGFRGSFQYLIPTNKVVQSNGLTFIDLSSINPQNAVGFYEATAHFRLAQLNHDVVSPKDGSVHNSSSLLAFEAGYQNNRGLAQLSATNPQMNTRDRYVLRFTASPTISNSNQTQITLGMEYSGGVNGGPHVIQLFFGTTLNPPKLFNNN
jgi:hypothetical protein